MAANPGVSHVRVMPDCHASVSCVVGFTARITDKVVPAWVGVDIGCGVLAYPLARLDGGELKPKELKRIDEGIRGVVPMGVNGGFTVHPQALVTSRELEGMFEQAKAEATAFRDAYKTKNPEPGFELPPVPDYSVDWVQLNKCKQVAMKFPTPALRALGSLGGGNHFMEINRSPDGVYYVTIHCGSRGFGGKICALHQGRIVKAKGL